MIRSRSEVAVISWPPSLPSASTALSWLRSRPCEAANDVSTARCSARMSTSARRANASPACTVQPGEEPVERDERAVRIVGVGEMLDEHRHELGEMRAGEFALQRTIAARHPAARGSRNLDRLAKPDVGEPVERVGVVGIRRKNE